MHIENKDQPLLRRKVLNFQFRIADQDWQTIKIPLEDLKKNDFRDDESLSEEIWERIYAIDSDAYKRQDEVRFCVSNFWSGIVEPCFDEIYARS